MYTLLVIIMTLSISHVYYIYARSSGARCPGFDSRSPARCPGFDSRSPCYDFRLVISCFQGAAVAEWLSSWLAEQEVRGSIPRLATWISEIGYLLLPSRDMVEIPLKRRKSSIQPTNIQLIYALFAWHDNNVYSNSCTLHKYLIYMAHLNCRIVY